jgi:hypothetical protein
MPRRFPPPWSVEETDACFIVRDVLMTGARLRLFRGGAGTALGGAPAHPRRGPAHSPPSAKLAEAGAQVAVKA